MVFSLICLLHCLRYMQGQQFSVENGDTFDVIVIGGGISGITAATKLADRMKVVVLEAAEDIGGRLKTSEIQLHNGDNFNFDEGASWIHGYSNKNPLKQVSKKIQGVKMIETLDDEVEVYSESGKNRDKQVDEFEQKVEEMVEKSEKFGPDVSMQNSIDQIDSSLLTNKYFMYHIGTNIQFETSGTIDKMSAVWDDSKFNGKEMLILSGYQNFVKGMAQQHDIPILLNHSVCEVVHHSQFSVVKCKNGVQLKSQYVIIGVPLGILKKDRIKFSPELPEKKQTAIELLGVGNVCKILINFEKINFLKTESHYIGVVADDCDQRGSVTYFLNLKKIAKIPALMTFGLGPNSDEIQYMDEETLKTLIAKRISCFAERTVHPDQFSIHRSSWRSRQHFRGAYSFATPSTTKQTWNDMAKPVKSCNWYFCGEHTYGLYRGTVHGAYLSGLRVSEEILSKLKQSKEQHCCEVI